MSIALVRVDCRLIHGQVVEAWVPHTGADCLVVVNDDLVANPFLRSVMELAVPPSIHVVFSTVAGTGDVLDEIERRREKAILLLANFQDALRLFQAGVRFDSVNIGNLHYASGKVEICPSVFFAREDFDSAERLIRLGVGVTVRATPFDSGKSLDPGGKGP